MKLSFNASEVEPNVGFEVVPAGKYTASIETIEQRDNKKNDGKHLAVMLNIESGKYEGRKLFDKVNLWNESEDAVKFAQGALSAICHATGVINMEDTDELIGIPLQADVRVTEQKVYGKKNTINAYHAVAGDGTTDEAEDLI